MQRRKSSRFLTFSPCGVVIQWACQEDRRNGYPVQSLGGILIKGKKLAGGRAEAGGNATHFAIAMQSPFRSLLRERPMPPSNTG